MAEVLLDRVSGTLSRYSMCVPGDHVAVAVSGGADSVCLLHVLHRLAPSLAIQLSVAHLNHKLRGSESDADADFAGRLAGELGLPFQLQEVNLSAAPGNLEQAGREARLAFFDSLPVSRVATGHTRSDQAETVLYRLLRGSGTAGLAGVLPVAGRRIRPLIDCSRSEVLSYLTGHGFAWREDATNADTVFVRNRIRHELLPSLKGAFPEVEEILARTAGVAQDEEAYWKTEIGRIAAATNVKRTPAGVVLNADLTGLLPLAVQRRLVRRAIQDVKGDLRQIDLFHVEAILSLVAQHPGHGRFQAPGIDVFRSFEWLLVARPRQESRQDRDYAVELAVPGRTAIPGEMTALRIEIGGYNAGDGKLDADRLSGPLELRNWRPGDQFCSVEKIEKIKTLFQLGRVPIWERQGWPVVTSGDRIVWTRRFGVSSEFVATRESLRILHIVEDETDSAESNGTVLTSLY